MCESVHAGVCACGHVCLWGSELVSDAFVIDPSPWFFRQCFSLSLELTNQLD